MSEHIERPFSTVKNFVAVATILASGFVATTAVAQSRGERAPQRTAQEAPRTITVSRIVERLMGGFESGKITSTQLGQYLLGSQDRLKEEESFLKLKEQLIGDHQAGEISREDIRPLLGEYMEALKAEMLEDMTESMKKAIQKGAMTQAQADEALGTYETLSAFKDAGLTRESFGKSQDAMQKMVASGKLTQQQMSDRLAAMKEMMNPKTGDARGEMREQYAKAKADLDQMVKDGKITQAQADARLNRMVEGMKSKTGDARGAMRERYAKAKADMDQMVKDGKITQEQADARLNQMVERMKQAGSRDDQDKTSDECMEMRRALGEAVRNGEITREEAGKKWKESDCGS
jgi:polyhydroxyalkanoate synthesis regulator phasin